MRSEDSELDLKHDYRLQLTVSVVEPLIEPFIWALMVTVPALTPCANPLFFFGTLAIVATAVLDDDHVMLVDLVRSSDDPSE